jgi:VanZ family protein
MTVTIYRILAAGWTLAILVAYSIPTTGLTPETALQVDKAAHFVMFLGFGFLWMHALHRRPPDQPRKATSPLRAWSLIGLGATLSVLAEVYQAQLPYRAAEPYDAAANMLGLAVAVGGFWWWYPSRSTRPSQGIHN